MKQNGKIYTRSVNTKRNIKLKRMETADLSILIPGGGRVGLGPFTLTYHII